MIRSDENVDVPKFRRIDVNVNNTDSNVWALIAALEETCWCSYIVICHATTS